LYDRFDLGIFYVDRKERTIMDSTTPVTKKLRASLSSSLAFHQGLVDQQLLTQDAAAELNKPLTATYLSCVKHRMELHANGAADPERTCTPRRRESSPSVARETTPNHKRKGAPTSSTKKDSAKKSSKSTGKVGMGRALKTMAGVQEAIADDLSESTTPLWTVESIVEADGFLNQDVELQVEHTFSNVIPGDQMRHIGRSNMVVWEIDGEHVKCMVRAPSLVGC
jgi:hypothetical protein